jgi:hypothetical protein
MCGSREELRYYLGVSNFTTGPLEIFMCIVVLKMASNECLISTSSEAPLCPFFSRSQMVLKPSLVVTMENMAASDRQKLVT